MRRISRSITIAPYLAITILLLVAISVACGGGNGEANGPEISDEDLAAMVLTQSDLEPELAGLSFQESSNFDTNESRLQEADDPEDETRDQETFGRLNGFDRQFLVPGALVEGQGVLLVAAGATLFEDTAGASGYLEDEVADVEGQVGQTDLGLLLESVERFEVSGVGDEAIGLRTEASTPSDGGQPTPIYTTYVWFRHGLLIGDVAIARLDDVETSDQALALATRLDERIQSVLRGELTPSP